MSLQGSLSRRGTSLTSHEELHAGKAQRASTGHDGARAPHKLPIRTLVAASVGNAVEWYDWTIYATFSIYFATQIFSAENESLAFILTFTTYASPSSSARSVASCWAATPTSRAASRRCC